MDNRKLLERVADLRYTFEKNFENSWFFLLLEGIPVDPLLLKDIRDFLKLDESWAITETRAREGIRNLELFILTLRHYLLPSIKERLRISPLKPDTMIKDPDQRAIRALVAYSMPLKIELLEEQVKLFKKYLDENTEPAKPPFSHNYSSASA